MELLNLFLKTVKELNKQGIEPIIYGSFGLNLVIGKIGETYDLDFVLFDEDFDRVRLPENQIFSFIKAGDVGIISIDKNNLDRKEMGGAVFYNLKPEQYLDFYDKLSKKEDRGEKREKDLEKIELIKKFLSKNKTIL